MTGKTITCVCGKKYTNVGAIPQLCPTCWTKWYDDRLKDYTKKQKIKRLADSLKAIKEGLY